MLDKRYFKIRQGFRNNAHCLGSSQVSWHASFLCTITLLSKRLKMLYFLPKIAVNGNYNLFLYRLNKLMSIWAILSFNQLSFNFLQIEAQNCNFGTSELFTITTNPFVGSQNHANVLLPCLLGSVWSIFFLWKSFNSISVP